jgi:riboflavin synthase
VVMSTYWLAKPNQRIKMFTGIIETLGKVEDLKREGTNQHILVSSEITKELKIDQSVAHNGVCLTVTEVTDNGHWVTAIKETLDRSSLGGLQSGDRINLERCMIANGRFDGHIVQGHVDGTASISSIEDQDGSWLFTFSGVDTGLIVEKGSICINGISLTCFNVTDDCFSVAIIPYTIKHTDLGSKKPGDIVNLEYDIVGKYVARLAEVRK